MPGENIQDWSTTAASNGTADSSIDYHEGQTRGSLNDAGRSVMAAVAKWRNLTNGSITTGGTSSAITFSSGLSYLTVPTGLRVLLKIGTTNAASATLNMDGIGAVTIKRVDATDLPANFLVAGSYAEFLYNGANWLALSVAPLALYREGTLTPVLSFGGASVGITYGVQQGIYTQIGRLINYTFEITLSSKGSSTGAAAVSGLPIASASSYKNAQSGYWSSTNAATTQLFGLIAAGQTAVSLYSGGMSTGNSVAADDTYFTSSTNVVMSGQYTI